jgi:ribokinase
LSGKSSRVVLLGDINSDVFLNVPAYPSPGGDALVYEMMVWTGGSVTNTAVVLARLGLQTCLISRTGADPWAEAALEALHKEGVDLSHVKRDPRAGTGLIFIPVTPDGERTMFSYRGANVLLEAAELDEQVFAGADLLHLSGYSFLKSPQKEAARRAIDFIKSHSGKVALDLGVEPAFALRDELRPLLPQLDLLVLGPKEAQALSGKPDSHAALDALLSSGVKLIGLKLGKEGCLLADPQEQVRLPGLAVPVVDTTGAGDAFSAGLIFGKLTGMSMALRAYWQIPWARFPPLFGGAASRCRLLMRSTSTWRISDRAFSSGTAGWKKFWGKSHLVWSPVEETAHPNPRF